MMTHLKLEWATPHDGPTTGFFWDKTGNGCCIKMAQFYKEPTITIISGHGSLILSQEQSAEMSLVLAYFAMSGKLPDPEAK